MQCDGCTLCCKLIDMPWINSPAGEYCKECNVCIGCKIHLCHPKECQEYACAYAQMERASINLRPDICGVIFERLTDDIFTGLVDKNHELNKDVLNQIKAFNLQGFSVLISYFGKSIPVIFPKEGKTGNQIFLEAKERIKCR